MRRRDSIREAIQNWSRPNPLSTKPDLIKVLNGLVPDAPVVLAEKWTGQYLADGLLKHVSGHLETLHHEAAKAALIRPDDRLKPDIAKRETTEARAAAVFPVLDQIAKTVAMAVQARKEAAEAFSMKVLALSEAEPAEGNAAIIRELRAQEIRAYARSIATSEGSAALVEKVVLPALAAGRFEVVEAVENAFPPIADLKETRMDWALKEIPEIAKVQNDLATIASDVAEAGQKVLGIASVAASRAVGDERKEWLKPVELETAFSSTAPLIKAGKAASDREEHALAIKALADHGKPQK